MNKRSCFRTPLGKKGVNGSGTLVKSARQHSYSKFPSIWEILSWKNFLLVRSEILGPFVNTFTADYKYSRYKREKFPQPVEMQLSKKRKTFCPNFIVFLKSILK